MSTDSSKHVEPLEQWLWPSTSSILLPMVGTPISNSNSGTKSTMTSSTALRRRHRHWWKVCWIYNNGNLLYDGINNAKQSNIQMKQQQQSAASLRVNDRCVHEDDLFATSSKSTSSKTFSQESHSLDAIMQQSTNYLHQQQGSSSVTSAFLPQKLTHPFTSLLRQKTDQNSIVQFFIQYKGANWRAEQLQYQIPSQDIQLLKQQSNEIKFVKNQQRKAQIKPQLFYNKSTNICTKCNGVLPIGVYGVKISIPNIGNSNIAYNSTPDDEDIMMSKNDTTDAIQPFNGATSLYHIECFTCVTCEQILVDLKAFLHSNVHDPTKIVNLYCYRHFVELFKPRCQYCDNLIFDDECTEAEGKVWHLGHFCCTECKRSLGGQQYIMADPSKLNDAIRMNHGQKPPDEQSIVLKLGPKQLPYCLTCFDILFGELCEECGELIGCDAGSISHEGRCWHAKNECFKCNCCSKPLLGKPFLPASDGRIYCSVSCSQMAFQKSGHSSDRKKKEKSSKNNISQTCENVISNSMQKISDIHTQEQVSSLPKGDQENRDHTRLGHTHQLSHFNKEITHDDKEKESLKTKEPKEPKKSLKSTPPVLKEDHQKRSNNLVKDVLKGVYNQHRLSKQNKQIDGQLPGDMPDFLLEYMRFQLQSQQFENGIIGATLEYGSSLSEDERSSFAHTNETEHNKLKLNNGDSNSNQMTTSSSSSSRNGTPLELINTQGALMANRTIKHQSSSSNETTPLLMRNTPKVCHKPLESRESYERTHESRENRESFERSHQSRENFQKLLSNNKHMHDFQTKPKMYDIPLQYNETPSQHTSVSNSISPLNESMKEDTPSTQSTVIDSTPSQSTPELPQRSPQKSVSFDPNVKETSSQRRKHNVKSRSNHNCEWKYWSDDDSSSSCSTCSSSSDDYFDYDSTLSKKRNKWYGGTRIQYVSNDRKKHQKANADFVAHNGANESCTIS